MTITDSLGMNTNSTNNNVLAVGGRGHSDNSAALFLRLIPSEFAYLLIMFGVLADCNTGFEVPAVPATCEVGERYTMPYNGLAETNGVGVCRPEVRECQDRGDGPQYYRVPGEEEVLPSEEVCDGLDNDCEGEGFVEVWNTIYNEGGYNYLNAVDQTNDNGFILAGSRVGAGLLIRADNAGNELWRRVIGMDAFDAVQRTSDGGFVLSTGGSLFKVNSEGYEEWNVGAGLLLSERDDGSFLAIRREQLLVIDAFGEEEVIRENLPGIIGITNRDACHLSSGNFAIVGEREVSGSFVAPLIVIDDEGNEIVNATFDDEHYQWFNSVAETSDGNLIIVGRSASTGRMLLVDQWGREIWNRTFEGPELSSVEQLAAGGFVTLSGSTSSGRFHGERIIRTDQNGFMRDEWDVLQYGDSYYDMWADLQLLSDGSLVVVGTRDDRDEYGSVGSDGWALRLCME